MTSKRKTVGVQKSLEFFFQRQDDLPHRPKHWSLREHKGSLLWELLNSQVLGTRSEALKRSQWRLEAATFSPKVVGGGHQIQSQICDLEAVGNRSLLIGRSNGVYLRENEDLDETVEVQLFQSKADILTTVNPDLFLAAVRTHSNISLLHTFVTDLGCLFGDPNHRLNSGYTDLKTSGENTVFASRSDGVILQWDRSISQHPIRLFKSVQLKTSLSQRVSSLQIMLQEHLVLASTLSSTMVFWDVRMSRNSVVPVMQTENLTSSIGACLALSDLGPIRIFGLTPDPRDPTKLAFVSRVHPLGIMAGILDLRSLTVSQMKMLNPQGVEDAALSLKSAWCPKTGTFITGNLASELCFVNLQNWTPPENSLSQDVVKYPVHGAIPTTVMSSSTGSLFCGSTEGVLYKTEL